MKQRVSIAIVVAAVFVVGGAVKWRAASASPPPVLFALGDSVTAGAGDDPDIGGYAARVSADLQPGNPEDAPGRATQFTNFAEGGATSSSILAPDGQIALAIADIGARAASSSVNDDVGVIVMSVGGNDLYGPLIDACADSPSAGELTEECQQAIAQLPALFRSVGQNLGTALGGLRAAAGSDATIVVLTYYNSLQACSLAPLAPLADMVLEGPDGVVASGDGFNDVIRGAAAAVPGVRVAETYGEIGPADLVGGADCLHPNESGHARIAEIVLDAVEAPGS